MPQLAQELNSQEADIPQPAKGFNLQDVVSLNLPGDLHPDQGTPGFQVATVLGRMNLHHIYSRPR